MPIILLCANSLNEEQRSRVMDCLAREDLHLLSGPFERLIGDLGFDRRLPCKRTRGNPTGRRAMR